MDANDNVDAPQQSAKRPRPVVSCLNCRRKKLKCDRRLPCEKCVKSGKVANCAYLPGQEPVVNDTADAIGNKRQRTDAPSPSTTSAVTPAKFEDLYVRVQQLEKALKAQPAPASPSPATDVVPASSSTFHTSDITNTSASGLIPQTSMHDQSPGNTLHQPLARQFEAVPLFVDSLGDSQLPDELYDTASELRHQDDFARKKRSHLQSTFRIYDSMPEVLAHMQRLLPGPSDCIALIQLYFQYFENCTRVLHRGTAWTQFRAYLNDALVHSQRQVCLPLLFSVVSIASSLGISTKCDNPKLHGQDNGIGAYHLIRNYLDLLTTKHWRGLSTIQLATLTLKYQKSSPLSAVEQWQWSGCVLRQAMAADLHNPRAVAAGIFETELRTRIWLTILELDLTFSIASNMPANCPMWQFEAPLNVDDGLLWPGMTAPPESKDLDEWTDAICQHVLARSFNDRLAAYSLVSTRKLPPYNTILQQTRQLEHIIHDLPQIFRLVSITQNASDTPPHRLLAKMELDFLLRRPLNACYAPYAADMPPDDRYKEARILWIQGTSFSICFQDLFDPKYPSLDLSQPDGLWDFYYNMYSWDVHMYFLSNCLELQRLRKTPAYDGDLVSPSYQGHTVHASVKVAGWNIEGITKSLEDTIDPLARRIGRHGSDFQQVVRWTTVIGSLRVSPTRSRLHAIKNELQGLVSYVRGRTMRCHRDQEAAMHHTSNYRNRPSNLKWLQNCLMEAESNDYLGAQT